MTIKTDLKNFYNTEAEKYYYTRNKHRSDGYIVLDEIKKYISTTKQSTNKTISILEFGCGWWRLIKFLDTEIQKQKLNIKINYIWIDISTKLLDFAQKDSKKFSKNITTKFITQDIYKYIKSYKQESIDFIIWIASFQHIPDKQERLFILKSFYKTLKYEWELIMLNRSLSTWFIKKYKQTIKKSILKTVYTLWIHDWRNLDIPREISKINNHWNNKLTSKKTIKHKNYYRFYHIFWIKELTLLWKMSWFKIKESTYIDKAWHKIKTRKKSNNTLFIWQKKVFIK